MNLLLTGNPGVGKTTIVRKVVQALRDALPLGGFLTEEIRERKQRVGFRIIALDTQDGAILSHVNIEGPYRVGRYGVCIEAMTDLAIPAVRRALESGKVMVVDEIGRMECFSPDFLQVIHECLESERTFFAVLQQRRLPFLDAIRDRDDVELIEVNERNRDSIPGGIVEHILRLEQV
jgi:nucleoside-triphosphatase